MPVDKEKFADDLTARVYEAQLRNARKLKANNATRAHKRKAELDPEVDENYIHPKGLRRSRRLWKIARSN